MPSRTKAQKLFGAACLKVGLERAQRVGSGGKEIYLGTLQDLGLSEEEVEAFLAEHRDDVERAWLERDKTQEG